jgi:CRP-like cAMP-binding protein
VTAPVTHSLVKALRTVPDLAALDDAALLKVVGASTNLFWPKGEVIFEKGSESEGLYIILSGEVRIFELQGGQEEEVSRIGPGNSFGELSLLLHTTHTKTAQTVDDTELMVVPKQNFQRLLDENAELAGYFRRRLEERQPLSGDTPAAT